MLSDYILVEHMLNGLLISVVILLILYFMSEKQIFHSQTSESRWIGESISMPYVWVHNWLLKVKAGLFVATFKKALNYLFIYLLLFRPNCDRDSTYIVSVIICVISDGGTFVNNDSASVLVMTVESSMLSCWMHSRNPVCWQRCIY